MTTLTKMQVDTLEYSFAHLNVDFEEVPSAKMHGTMEGVQQQLDSVLIKSSILTEIKLVE